MAGSRASARRRAALAAVIALILLAFAPFLLSATADRHNLREQPCLAEDQVAVLAPYATHACRLDEASAAQTDAFIATSTCLSSTASQTTVTEKETRPAHWLLAPMSLH
jgi:alpha-1,4-galacturonosyltransferase